jgi:hypothetical protein
VTSTPMGVAKVQSTQPAGSATAVLATRTASPGAPGDSGSNSNGGSCLPGMLPVGGLFGAALVLGRRRSGRV